MDLKLLFVINDNEKSLKLLTNEFTLPFNTVMHGEGTASQGILDFLGLEKTEKIVLTSIIPDIYEKEIMSFIKKEMTKAGMDPSSKLIPRDILKRKTILNLIFIVLLFHQDTAS